MNYGKFIVLESLDGAGKGTIVSLLKEKYTDFVFTREPGGTESGEKLRTMLLDSSVKDSKRTEVLLAYAARQMHLEQLIRPALASGKIVLSERFNDSTFAYQGQENYRISRDMIDFIFNIDKEIVKEDDVPDLVILLDISPETSRKRRKIHREPDKDGWIEIDKFELFADDFFETAREIFYNRANFFNQRKTEYIIINAEQSIEVVFGEVVNAIGSIIK